MPLKCIVFDCDGVILDSVPVKTRAFKRLAEPYGAEAADRFEMYHSLHGGVSRYLKFEWFFKEILNREITSEEKAEWSRKFEKYALDEVRKCQLIPGALETLQTWRDKLPLYVCTGAPQAEVSMILAERGLSHYFKAIYGSPPIKSRLLTTIIKKDACLVPEEVVMVGDARTDLEAAEENGSLFYGVGPELKGGNFPWSPDLLPLNEWIKAHAA